MLKELGNLIVKINFSEFTNIKFLIVFMSIIVKTTKRISNIKSIVIIITMVHHSLSSVLTRQGWKVSLLDVGLSKTLRIRPTPCAANSEEDNT